MSIDLAPLPERIPDFFIIGGPKCGTTSLFAWLRQHPDTYLPAKEPNFLSRDVYDARDVPGALVTWEDYLDALLPKEAGKLSGESTPRYLYSDQALQVLSQHPSQPKLIAILRNPIDLVFSLHGQMLRQGVETEVDFARAWARALTAQGDPAAWMGPQGLPDHRLDYPLYGRLGTRMAAVQAACAPDQLRVLILEEDLGAASQATLEALLPFLGLAPYNFDLARENTRTELRSAALQRYLIGARNSIRSGLTRIGVDVSPARGKGRGTGLMALFARFNTAQPTPASKIDPDVRARLAIYFAPDVSLLRRQLGRSLPHWNDWPPEVAP